MTKHKKEKFIHIFIRRLIPALIITLLISLGVNRAIYGCGIMIYNENNREMVQSYITKIQDAYRTGTVETNPNQAKLSLSIIAEVLNDVHSDAYAVVTDADGNVIMDSTREVMIVYRPIEVDPSVSNSIIYSCDVDTFKNVSYYYDFLKADYLSDVDMGIREYYDLLYSEGNLIIDSAYINNIDYTFLPIAIHVENVNDEDMYLTYSYEYSDAELEGYELADPDNIRMSLCLGSPDNTALKEEIFEELSGADGIRHQYSPTVIPGSLSYGIITTAYDSDNNPYTIYCYTTTPNTARVLIFVYLFCDGIIILIGFLIALFTSIKTHRKNQYFYKMEEYRKTLMDSMAHDLKSPLMAMSGYAENLKANIQTEKKDHYADAIYDNVQYMNEIISNVMELSKLESFKTDLKPEKCDLVAILSELKEKYNPLIEQKNISFNVTGSTLKKVDKKLITQALENLLTNSVKYCSENGTIEITGTAKALSIKNTISQELTVDTKKLWEPFVKDDVSRTNKSGSGLGLAIVKNILEYNKLKGKIETHDNWFEVKIY